MMVVASDGKLSTMGTTVTSGITDKVDSPHSGLYKALHHIGQGNIALDFGDSGNADGDITNTTYGFTHTFTWSGSYVPTVAVTGGSVLFEGKWLSVHDTSGSHLELSVPPSGSFYHWVSVNSSGALQKTLGTSDGVVPDLPTQSIPISLIRVQSTDTSGDLATQFFTTRKTSNSVSIGYADSNEYTEAMNITASSGDVTFKNTVSDKDIIFNVNDGGVNTEVMRIDGSTSRVGIGTTSPDNPLHISASTEPYIRIENTDTALTEGQVVGGLAFEQNDSTGSGTGITGRIQMRSADRPDNGSYFGNVADIDFLVSGASTGVASDNATKTAMTIRAGTGNVGIGTTAPNSQLEVRGPTGTGTASAGVLTLSTAELTVVDSDQLGRIDFQAPLESGGSDAILVAASIWAEADDTFAANNNETDLVFATATTAVASEKMRLGHDGKLGIGTGGVISAPLHIEYTGAGDGLILESTETGTSNAPDLVLYRNPLDGSGDNEDPSDDDELGVILFRGKNDHASGASSNQNVDYAYIAARTTDVTDTSEEAALKFGIYSGGSSYTLATLGKPNVDTNATVHAGWHTRPATAIVASATYAPDVASSGTLVIFNNSGSNLTLPSVNNTTSVGVQFTVFNETGSAINGQIATSDSATINGGAASASDDIASYKAATFVCSGNNTWIRIG